MTWIPAVAVSLLFAVVVVWAFTARGPKDIAGIEIALANGATLVDVRSPAEFAGGHLEGAINIPVGSIERRLHEIPKDKPVVLYCASGMRSLRAEGMLKSKGYDSVLDLGAMSNARLLSGRS